MPGKGSPVKAEVEKAPQGVVVFRESHDAVSDIPRREDTPLFPESSGASALVGDGDNRNDIPGKTLQAAQEG